MKSLHRGLIAAITITIVVTALLGSTLWVMAQSAPPGEDPPAGEGTVEASEVQDVDVVITATVGTNPSACATTSTIQVRANTIVYYCFRVQHTGVSGDESLTRHNVRTSRGLSRDIELTIAPGTTEEVFFAGTTFTDVTNVDVTTVVTWVAQTPNNQQVSDTSQVHIDVVTPTINVVKTASNDPNSCGGARTLTVTSGQNVAFCISVTNTTTDVTFTNHTLTDQALSINATFNYTLTPGQRLDITHNSLSSLGISGSLQRQISSNFTNNASVESRAATAGLNATGTSSATVSIGSSAVAFAKTISTEPEECSGSSTIQVNPGTNVYYCVTIQNTGSVTLTHHRLEEQHLSIDVSFDYPLRPGERITITNGFLAAHDLPIVFGPFEVHPRFGINNLVGLAMNYTGTSPDGITASGSANTSATLAPTPTWTPTDRPEPTSTNTPAPTIPPTETPIPPTPTPTFSPTPTPVTPSPTPTRSYAISLLETPTPRAGIAGMPGAAPENLPQDPSQQPTIDPNLPPGQFPEPPPVQDPVLATATQIAVDATATTIAATSTAISAEATAAQQAIENAQATALAEAQAGLPDSPLPTPTLDPATVQDGSATGLETPTAMPAETPTGGLPVDSQLPGADVTVMPPVVTVVVATETPAVVVLVVTNTPEPGAALPEGQRPVVLPTPTPTPDFVMAAARTFDVAVATMGWLWFLVGSLIFFVTAGIVAGLFFRQSEVNRFEIPEPDYWLEEELPPDRRHTAENADDEWPADLP